MLKPDGKQSINEKSAMLTPTFAGLRAASKSSSFSKQRNSSTDTSHEILLRRALSTLGLRYRKNVQTLLGKPDIVFRRAKVVVFCDGDFWHGRDWRRLRIKLKGGTNGTYWEQKIGSNIARDRKTTAMLRKAGWTVIRFWESDIKSDPHRIAKQIFKVLSSHVKANNR